MAKKLVTIDVNDKELTVTSKLVDAKTTKTVEKTEMEKLGFVEINNTANGKKAKATVAKGFEKNLCEGARKNVKAQTSMVEDYFDFSFRKNEKAKDVKEEVVEKTTSKTTARKTTTKTSAKTSKKSVEDVVKIDEDIKLEQNVNVVNTVNFDNEVNQIIRVARIGSLFDCDKRTIQA